MPDLTTLSLAELARLSVAIRQELARREAPQGVGITNDHFDYLDSLDALDD